MKLISFLFGISRQTVILSTLASIISGASSIGLIMVINIALDETVVSQSLLAWSFAGLCLLRLLASIASRLLLAKLGQEAIFNLRLRLSRQILATPLRDLEEVGTHRLLAALTSDTSALMGALTAIPTLSLNAIIVLGSMAYLAWISWSVALAALSFIILGIITYRLPIIRAHYYFKKARETEDALFQHFRALTEGVKELKLHFQRRLTFISDVLRPTAADLKEHFTSGITVYAVAGSWGNLLFFIFIGLLVFALPLIVNSERQDLISYTLIILFMMTPLQTILSAFPSLGQANVSLKKLEALGLSITVDSEGRNGLSQSNGLTKPNPMPAWQRLNLTGVTHTYQREGSDHTFTLGPIDLTFCRGELVFLIGGNGSGKTTLAKLLTGLYTPKVGEISLDEKSIYKEEISLETYRQLFSVIFADFYLFDSFLGLDKPNLDVRAHNYLAKLQLDHKVHARNGALSTTELSQGQRKRLALLVAYLEDRPFYVFDEWAAEQDVPFREFFYTEILKDLQGRGKTVLVITHDDKYYHLADRIIKLEYGQLV